jgi:5-methylcytosine-specific restriction endonuclease McrA
MLSRYKKYKETYSKYYKKWYKLNQNKLKQYRYDGYNNYNYGGLRDFILERDNWTCQVCGMTNEQHILIFGRNITIDHIDGAGCNTPKKDKNNDPDNLITLCLRCHGSKDSFRRWKK